MKIEDKRNEEKKFGSLKNGDVFKYANNLYMKMDPFYPDGLSSDIEFMKKIYPMNAYNLISQAFVIIPSGAEVRAIKATFVIEQRRNNKMEIVNNTEKNKVKIDKLKIGELFLFNEKLYMKIITCDVQYYMALIRARTYGTYTAIDVFRQRLKEWDDQKDLSSFLSDHACNVFNLTDNCLEYLEDATVTLAKGALTIEIV